MTLGWDRTIRVLHDLLVTDVERRDDGDDVYLSIPVGYAEAIEVESGTGVDAGNTYVTYRRWDRTHGLAEEVELATAHQVTPARLAAVVAGFVQEHQRRQDSLERQRHDANPT